MSRSRDIDAYRRRATSYDAGPRGGMHARIVSRTATLALDTVPRPSRVLDVGCGTGLLLKELLERAPSLTRALGIDPASEMVEIAARENEGSFARFSVETAEQLSAPNNSFDLIVSSTSFSHWHDPGQGLKECARVLAPGGYLVLVDVFSTLALPIRLFGPGGAAGSKERASRLLDAAGFERASWHPLFASVIKAAVAQKPARSVA
jgi:ubiquinone/menaquinone biosynthesis C-methylase UbiE